MSDPPEQHEPSEEARADTESAVPATGRGARSGNKPGAEDNALHWLALALFGVLLTWPILSIAAEHPGLDLLAYITGVWLAMTFSSFLLTRRGGGARRDS